MKKRLNNKRILIAILILLVMILSIFFVLTILKEDKEEFHLPSDYDSIENLLKYYGCTDIQVKNSDTEPFKKDIYLIFGEELWNGDQSNEAYYSNMILYLTEILEYKSYRMIDSSRELVIAVITNENNKTTDAIYINGETNYFQKEEARRTVKNKYSKTIISEIEIQSPEIKKLIQNEWNPNSLTFGTRESRFEDYDIYFDEGIEVKTIGGKVYNIIFTEKYKGNIINNLRVNSTNEEIKKTLGNPAFETKSIIGYKGEDTYVFFSENEVSLYRVEKEYKSNEFLKLFNEFLNNKNAVMFVNKLTNLWKDYDRYIYNSNFISLQYSLRGIKVEINTTGENGLIIYNNYLGQLAEGINLENIAEENLNGVIFLHTDIDLVFEDERKRISIKPYEPFDEYIAMLDNEHNVEIIDEENPTDYAFSSKQTEDFLISYEYTNDEGIYNVKFISKNRNYPNSELIKHKQVYTYGWLDNEQFLYSVKQEGIYCYNAKTRTLKTIIEGRQDFKIVKVENNTVFYDTTSIKL